MIERKVIKFNARLGDKFFEVADGLPDLESLRAQVSFPLPTSVMAMPEFFRGPQASLFKKGISGLILRLHAWCLNNHIHDSENVLRFLNICKTYHGRDPEVNALGFELLSSGMVLLNAIVSHCESGKIPKAHCCNVLINLLPGLTVCSPGIYTNLYKAWCSLVAQNSLAHELMQIRHHLAEQSAIVSINALKSNYRVHSGSEIHYVNALLNSYHEVLGLPVIVDPFLQELDDDILTSLMKLFVVHVTQKLKPSVIINEIIQQLNVAAFCSETTSALQEKNYAKFNSLIDDFELRLNRYGDDKINIDQILMLNEDSTEVTGLAFFCHEELYASLQRRFVMNGYFTTENFKQRKLSNGAIIYTNNHIPLSESFIEWQESLRGYIPFMMDQIINNGPLLDEFKEHINSSSHFKRQITEAIIEVLHLNDQRSQLTPNQELQCLRFLCVVRSPNIFTHFQKLSRYYRYHLAKTMLSACYPDEYIGLCIELIEKFDIEDVNKIQFKMALILLQGLCGATFSINQYNPEVGATGLQIAQMWQCRNIEKVLIRREKALITKLSTRTVFHQPREGSRLGSELSDRKAQQILGRRV